MAPKRKHSHLLLAVMERITDMSYPMLFLIWTGLALGFAGVSWALSYIPGQGPQALEGLPPLIRFMDALYFSVITTATVGYGDITPNGISRILAAAQSVSAVFIFAVFVTKLVSHRQEITLREIHRMTFEDVFRNTREGLFIARNDLDRVIRDIEVERTLDQHGWRILLNAFRQIESMLAEIPDFYANGEHDLTIDATREQLLLEAVHRTFHRVNKTLDVMTANSVAWTEHGECMTGLQKLTKIVSATTPLWRERSPYTERAAFEDIMQLNADLHARTQQTGLPGDPA